MSRTVMGFLAVLLVSGCAVRSLRTSSLCLPPRVDTADWQVVDAGDFTLRVPPGFIRRPFRGIDSSGGGFDYGKMRVSYSRGFHGFSLVPSDPQEEASYRSCKGVLGGREATLATWRLGPQTNAPGTIFVGANWDDIGDRRVADRINLSLAVSGTSRGRAGQRLLLAIIHTVRFKT